MLELTEVHAFYGESHVLHGLELQVKQGELVTLLGRNGVGKTTTLRAIMGLVRRGGRLSFKGRDISRLAPEQIARLGIGYVPEERGIFASLSVEENLMLPPVVRAGGMDVAEIYQLFPNLKERRASQGTHLSGGEQQMLAIARTLRTGADLILLDEPTEGLAPVVVDQIAAAIRGLKQRGMTLLLVEQNFHFARTVADRHCVVEEGRVVETYLNSRLDDRGVLERLNARLGL